MRLSRRGALIAAAAVPLAVRADIAHAGRGGDAAEFEAAMELEQAVLFAYGAAVSSGGARVRALARRFVHQEADHIEAIGKALEAIGGKKALPLQAPPQLDLIAADLGIDPVFTELRTPRDVLEFLLALEEALIAFWVRAQRSLGDARLIQMAAAILGCQAQHAVVLRQALGRDPLPRALETGRSS